MIDGIRRILVLSIPKVTGGPELLHQLVHVLRQSGHEASIVYMPFDGRFECPEPYRIYDAPQSRLIDEPDVLLVIPEVATGILRRVHRCQVAVWWLSVDNYLCVKRESRIRDLFVRCKSLIRHRLPLSALREYRHFVQSEYAAAFLRKARIESTRLSDHLNLEHISAGSGNGTARRNTIIYNPEKGRRHTERLRAANPDLDFIPVRNMTPQQVKELLAGAKLYIDFGHHPGKDRLPREAAMAGCCIITGRRGAAANQVDIPIPEDYKLDEGRRDFPQAFRARATSIFDNFARHSRSFDGYREGIRNEPAEFERQVRAIFGSMPASSNPQR